MRLPIDVGSDRTILIYPSIEAIAELKMLRNSYGPEYVNQRRMVGKGGTRPFLRHWSRLRIRRTRAEAPGCIVLGLRVPKWNSWICDLSISFHSLPTTISFIGFAAPLNAQSVQDEFISDRQLAAVQDQPIDKP